MPSFGSYGRCRYCGKEVFWQKLKSGKKIPCDPRMIGYRIPTEGKGQETIVTTGGEVIKADRVYDDNADGMGYISHFATCPLLQHVRNMKNRAGSSQYRR